MRNDADAVGEVFRLFEVVRREQDRRPVSLESLDECPERPPRLGVEARGRFVEEEEFGAPDDPERNVEASSLAARHGLAALTGKFGKPDRREYLVGVARVREEAPHVSDVLSGAERGLVRAGLEHDADAFAPVEVGVRGIVAEDAYLA